MSGADIRRLALGLSVLALLLSGSEVSAQVPPPAMGGPAPADTLTSPEKPRPARPTASAPT